MSKVRLFIEGEDGKIVLDVTQVQFKQIMLDAKREMSARKKVKRVSWLRGGSQ